MSSIASVDKNLKVETNIKKDGLKFYDVKDEPFKVYGVIYENGTFRRIPQAVADSVSAGVALLNRNTAGGRVRFRTDSPYVVIKSKGETGKLPHMALVGVAGFDLYHENDHIATFMPPNDTTWGFESIAEFGREKKMREITINFPLYSCVEELYVGLDENATVEAPTEYKITKPVVYYGSSITQGGCASRPGTCYQGYITRKFDCDYINLGFSGNGKAEDEIAEYIAGLDMSLFVYDYDHNAPTLEHLEKTHERMFKIIRQKNPDLPIIMMPRPKYDIDSFEDKRSQVILRTYNNAKESGDKNVYFISSKELCALCANDGTVDRCHPTDAGFLSMAKAVIDCIEKNNLL